MSNRLPLALLLALTLVPVAVSVPANAEAPEKVTVCHIDGNGVYRAISISDAAYDTHKTHGDLEPGDLVPGYPLDGSTYKPVFQPNCGVLEDPDRPF
jgi:hypothetical protein